MQEVRLKDHRLLTLNQTNVLIIGGTGSLHEGGLPPFYYKTFFLVFYNFAKQLFGLKLFILGCLWLIFKFQFKSFYGYENKVREKYWFTPTKFLQSFHWNL